MLKKFGINILLFVISVSLTFWLAEWVFKKMIFGPEIAFEKYRVPSDYARDWDDNFWKLQKIWRTYDDYSIHPVFGWAFRFHPAVYIHPDFIKQKNRRPVLIYGDSFVSCVTETNDYCWDDLLNSDTTFNKDHFLFNYGIGAHGVDQIYSVFRLTYEHYPKPLVLFTFMIGDLDRSILTFREGQKPQYRIQEDGKLIFDNSMIRSTSKQFIIENPLTINSYLFRKFLFSDLNFLPESVTRQLSGENFAKERIVKLNSLLIKNTVASLRDSKTDFMFVIFNQKSDYSTKPEENWRVNFVKSLLDSLQVPYYFTLDAIKNKLDQDSTSIKDYFIPNDGHPTALYNQILAKEFVSRINGGKYEHNSVGGDQILSKHFIYKIDSIKSAMMKNPADVKFVESEAIKYSMSLSEMYVKAAFDRYWYTN